MNIALSYPALNGEVVTEAHAKYCQDNGHASYSLNGVSLDCCPRCGELTIDVEPEAVVNSDIPSRSAYYNGRYEHYRAMGECAGTASEWAYLDTRDVYGEQ